MAPRDSWRNASTRTRLRLRIARRWDLLDRGLTRRYVRTRRARQKISPRFIQDRYREFLQRLKDEDRMTR